MELRNSTTLSSARLYDLFLGGAAGWRHDGLDVRVRYSRGAEFSGSCHYATRRLHINLGRDNTYPYTLKTHIARARSETDHWWRELYRVDLADAYQLALFLFLHEFYHHLVKEAKRNPRQKEGMCDRFAVRHLVDHHGAVVRHVDGREVPRRLWDFQDLDGFVWPARAAS